MSQRPITRLETHLERLIEGAFAHLFGGGMRAQDLAVQLARAVETGLIASEDSDPRPIAPDHFLIRMHPDLYDHLLIREPGLSALLASHIVGQADAAAYRLRAQPVVSLVPAGELAPRTIDIICAHQHDPQHTTQTLDGDALKAALQRTPTNAMLIIDGDRRVALTRPLITIGRGRDNDIVLADQTVSRQHIQLRLRYGAYFAFDVNSQSGVTVNEVQVREHRLQPGDVLRIGRTHLLYLDDSGGADGQTDILSPPEN